MKKVYEAPTAEKIAFRYRDQVVAASGVPVANADQSGDGEAPFQISSGSGCDIINGIAKEWGDGKLCIG